MNLCSCVFVRMFVKVGYSFSCLKYIAYCELRFVSNISGKLTDGQKKVKGTFEIPNLSEENEADEIVVSCDIASSHLVHGSVWVQCSLTKTLVWQMIVSSNHTKWRITVDMKIKKMALKNKFGLL